MTFQLILSQGRIADRTPGAIAGAALTAEALSRLTGLEPVVVGNPAPAQNDDWSTSLPAARETLVALEAAVRMALQHGSVPLLANNTCSASLATLPAVAQMRPDAIILWIAAHGDFNTPQTTASGYLGGMALAAACGLWDSGHGAGVDPARVVLIGARDIDPQELGLLQAAGVRIIRPEQAMPEAVLAAIGEAPVWVHVDWDVLEPDHVPAAYTVRGGLLPDRLRAIFEALPPNRIAGIELAEFEASGHAGTDEAAMHCLCGIVSPLLSGR